MKKNEKKNILIIGYTHPKHDKRVIRTVESLCKHYNVFYQYAVSPGEKDSEQEDIFLGNVKFLPLIFDPAKESTMIKKFTARRPFDKKLLLIIKSRKWDAIYFHHFCQTFPVGAFRLARKNSDKIIYDVHENHPENFLNTLHGVMKKIKEFFMWKVFKKQLILSDRLVLLSEDFKKEVFSKTGVEKSYFLMPNYACMKAADVKKEKTVVYVGKITRGFESEIKIIKELVRHGFKFRVIGSKNEAFNTVEHECTGFLPYGMMMQELSKASFSIVSYSTVSDSGYMNDILSLPHKYYDSLAAGTPVIVKNSFTTMCNEVRRYGCGIIIDVHDVPASINEILKAYENYGSLQQNLINCIDNFVWDKEKEEQFINFII